jgi:hypothetical protein
VLVTTQCILYRTTNATLSGELLADRTLLVEWTTNALGRSAQRTLLYTLVSNMKVVMEMPFSLVNSLPVNCFPIVP